MRQKTLLAAALAWGCDSDNAVKTVNSVPEVSITSHSDGAVLLEGYTVTFRGVVTDNNHAPEELIARWYAGDEPLCDASPPESDGLVQCVADISSGMTGVRLQVQDPQNAAGLASIAVSVEETSAPTAEIISPSPSETYYSNALILFSALIQDAEDDSADLTYSWTSSLDGELPITVQPESSGEVQQYLGLTPGQHAITLSVTDSSNKTTNETVAIIVGGENQAPSCSIDTPLDGSVYTLGQAIAFSGTAVDPDINNTDLVVRWTSSIDGLFDETTANTDGSLAFVYDDLTAGNHTILLQVEDEVRELCQDSVLLTVGTPPTLSLQSPQDGALFLTGEAILFEGTVSDSEDIPSDVALSWTSSQDGEFSTIASDSTGNVSLSYNGLSPGPHSIIVTATDSSGLTDSVSLSLDINTPPTAPTVSLSPSPAYTTDTLQASIGPSTDADGDPITYSYLWTQNGLITSFTSTSVPSSATAVGENWLVRVTPNDGYSDGAFAEQSILIENSLPTVDSVSISPTVIYNDTLLTCTAQVSDADQTVTPSYEWTVGTTSYSGATLDLGATSAMPNDVILCTATVSDSNGGSDSSGLSRVVDNRAPTVSNVVVNPSVSYTNSSLNCTASSSDSDGESLTESIDWQVNGLSIGSGSSLTLDPSMVSVGDTVECHLTVTDPSGLTDTLSTGVQIQNIAPTVDSFDLSPVSPTAVDVLTCSASGSDLDLEALTTTFSWLNQSSGETYQSTSSSSSSAALDLSQVSVTPGDSVTCTAVILDPNGDSASQSASVIVLNSAPVFDVPVSISPSNGVYTNTQLTCSAVVSDPNDGALSPVFEWSVNGVVVGSGSSYTVSAAETDVGNEVVCTATATDSDGEVTTSSAFVTVTNTEPVVGGVSISPSTGVYNDSVLSCSGTVVDPDENLTLVYSWTVNTLPLGTGSSIDLGVNPVLPNDMVGCYATAVDSSGATHTDSASVSVSDRAPSAPVVLISPASPVEGLDDLVCTASGSVDPDGQNVSYSYEWLSDTGVSVFSDIVSANFTASDEVWTCAVTASDGNLTATGTSSVQIEADGVHGTVRKINGTWIDVTYEPCGNSCTASQAKAACTSIGKKVVSHASNGTSEVYSLGATYSCQHSISYYTVDVSMSSNQCLIGISNLDWSGCCNYSQWHGNTVNFGAPNDIFGYVQSGNTGYVSSYNNNSASTWGCHGLTSPAAPYSSCNEYYVACH
ncbi:MAG: hypothetical protein VX026_00730 [Myxococcota bacterium]|nr:hypothetical protein [Myxococcota bacterium]